MYYGGLGLKNDKTFILGFVAILIIVVMVSGCTSSNNEKIIGEFNLPKQPNSQSIFSYINVTIPDGAKSVKIEYQNITQDNVGMTYLGGGGGMSVYAFNVAPAEGQEPSNYMQNRLDVKTLDVSTTGLNGTMEFTQSGIKGLIISSINVKGTVKVFATT